MNQRLAGQRIAVVGAGIAGLACARRLRRQGAEVVVFEAQRQVGGRVATLDTASGPFDTGAQYFTARHHAFERALGPWLHKGLVAPWTGRIVALWRGASSDKSVSAQRYVALPGMRALAEELARGLDVRLAARVSALRLAGMRWQLELAGEPDLTAAPGFDCVALAVPPATAGQLLPPDSPLRATLDEVHWESVWALLLALPRRVPVDFDGAFVNDDPLLAWLARDSAKPARPKIDGVAERWVLHAQPRWSREHAQISEADAIYWLSNSFVARVGKPLRPVLSIAQRWDHARPLNPLPGRCLWDAAAGIGVAGDWCGGPRVEGAFLSGLALAEKMVFD
jgi:predicted NAD/FAD-dependent oxidoreductase